MNNDRLDGLCIEIIKLSFETEQKVFAEYDKFNKRQAIESGCDRARLKRLQKRRIRE